MHLLRVRVPDFRALKDVDITFEKEAIPRIFPLGSENGGGKSTLLQLIFLLLHCPTHPDRLPALRNLMMGFKLSQDHDSANSSKLKKRKNNTSDNRLLAIIDIWDGEKCIEMEFFCCNPKYIKNNFLSDRPDRSKLIGSHKPRLTLLTNVGASNSILHSEVDSLRDLLEENNLEYILTYPSGNESNDEDDTILLCKTENLDRQINMQFFNDLSNKVFLTAPSTQVFLFLTPETKKLLFAKPDRSYTGQNYYEALNKFNQTLPGLFTYDFLAVNILVNYFLSARDRDFKQAVTTGEYGNSYKAILSELNSILTNKQINVTPDLAGIAFTMKRNNETVDLYPEDLSHGELKRLSIYGWLKGEKIEDAIVLMDEIDIALHPDWQYRIVQDLTDWGASNQYILATHSYELCQALTPAHVKELDPKLSHSRS